MLQNQSVQPTTQESNYPYHHHALSITLSFNITTPTDPKSGGVDITYLRPTIVDYLQATANAMEHDRSRDEGTFMVRWFDQVTQDTLACPACAATHGEN